MVRRLIEIENRMYAVAEVAKLIGHKPAYAYALIEAGKLEATRPEGPGGDRGQWRVFPGSLLKYLGVPEPKEWRRRARRAKAEMAEWEALCAHRESKASERNSDPR